MGLDAEKVVAQVLASVKKNLNVPGFTADMIDTVLSQALDEVVADTSNPMDDMLKAAIYPALSAALKKALLDLWAKLPEGEAA